MNSIAAMSKALLEGKVLSVMNCFRWFGVTNASREIGRGIERKFMVKTDKKKIDFTSRYGQSGFYYEYRLFYNDLNKPGIELMRQYVAEHTQSEFKNLVKKGAKRKHVPENEPLPTPSTQKIVQKDLFSNL